MPANLVIDTSAILAVLLDEPEKQAVVEATMGSVVCAPASLRWEVGNAATAGVKRRRLTAETREPSPPPGEKENPRLHPMLEKLVPAGYQIDPFQSDQSKQGEQEE